MKTYSHPIFLVIVIMLTASIGYMSIDMYLPSLPAMTKQLLIQPEQSQFTVTLFLIGFCCSQLIYGPLSDQYGRKPILLFGFAVYLLATLLCVGATNIEVLLLGRLLQGLGIGAGAVLSRVMLRDQFSGNKLAQMASYLNVGVSVVTTFSPGLGGLIQEHFNYQGNFIALFFTGIVTLGLLMISPETNINRNKSNFNFKDIISSYLCILSNKVFVCNVICAGVALSVLIAYSIINPFLMQTTLGLSAQEYGVFALLIAGCEVLGSLFSGYFVVKVGSSCMLLLGYILMLVMSGIMIVLGNFVQPNWTSILIPTMGVAISIGIILPNAGTGAFSIFTSGIGVAGALYGFIQLLIAAIISSLIASLIIQSQVSTGLTIVFLSSFGLLSYSFLVLSEKLTVAKQTN